MSTTHVRSTKPFLTAMAVTGAGVGAAYLAGAAFPVLSALTIAVVLGILTGSVPSLSDETRKAISGTTKKLLRAGVVLLGLQLSLPSVLALGPGTLLAVVLTVGITFLGTIGLGRLLGVPRGLAMLVATGFSVCGASAIAAMEGVVEREDSDVATAVALVTFYGGLAIAAVPLLGGWLRLDAVRIGEWAGLSVHEVAQVVAAATPAGGSAIAVAIVLKLSRVVLLAPMVAAVGVHERHRPVDGKRPPLVPLFVLGFLAMAAVRSTGIVPGLVLDAAKIACTLLLAGALFGLGCAVRIGELVRTGGRALLLGLLSTLLVGTTALVTLTALG
ncbi:putative sulfate exporter family transporter [Amycolatopsis sp. QT-25]|uniref:YeiH family protein n=1 Tax=Amycolatopsis sp. QT-25 TaxID=3034022 RepID=UPI0023EA88B1|nr:putative sulfate exporter family transporter [Amycolatopsis sp. QT-25]WET82301.1 putative sulfate exporter family transporter [Amycolatopsis sp. QT-25]